MKKNKMMRLASILLIAVLMSTCVISGTFAKYTDSKSETDSARVAKWGVQIALNADEAFANEYTSDVASNPAPDVDAEVKGTSEAVVIAPGTKGTLATASISGTTEVAVQVTKTAGLELTGAWVADGAYYCPISIKVTINGTPTTFNGMDYNSIDEFVAAVNGAITADAKFAPNANIGYEITVEWAWAIEGGAGQTNAKDTILGAAATEGDINISFSLAVGVDQIDTYTPAP